MRKEDIIREIELGVRAFLEANERSKISTIDDFEETRILESSFNRLFLSIEHTCNALLLLETGNFSPKHFGDFTKFKELKEKYKTDFQSIYQETYTFRSYGDYRKFPEIKEKFDRKNLKEEIVKAKIIINIVLEIIDKKTDVSYLQEKISTEERKKS